MRRSSRIKKIQDETPTKSISNYVRKRRKRNDSSASECESEKIVSQLLVNTPSTNTTLLSDETIREVDQQAELEHLPTNTQELQEESDEISQESLTSSTKTEYLSSCNNEIIQEKKIKQSVFHTLNKIKKSKTIVKPKSEPISDEIILNVGKELLCDEAMKSNNKTFSKKHSKFSLDPSKYEDLIKNKFVNNDLMKTTMELKTNFPFKEFLKQSLYNTDKVTPVDICGLDDVLLATKANDSLQNNSIQTDIDCSSLYFKTTATSVTTTKRTDKVVEDLMKKSVLPDDLERMEKVPILYESKQAKKLERKKKAEETAGKGWYNLPKTEVTEEVKRDLQLIKMRNVLNRKQHYKRNDTNKLPKYFQIGTIVEGAHEFYSARVSKKKRKATVVDELLEDAEFRRRNKKKFLEIQKKKMSGGKGFYKKKNNQRKPTWART